MELRTGCMDTGKVFAGTAYYSGWVFRDSVTPKTNWVAMCLQNGGTQGYINDRPITTAMATTRAKGEFDVYINHNPSGCCGTERSNFGVAFVVSWNRDLSMDEMKLVSSFLRKGVGGGGGAATCAGLIGLNAGKSGSAALHQTCVLATMRRV